jgi:Tol biopolymer transport system component
MNSRNGNRKPIWLVSLVICFTAILTAGVPAPLPDDPPQYSDWSAPVNLGPVVNWPDKSDQQPCISKDGLSLFFASGRPGGFGVFDIYVSQRASVNDPWGLPQNLGLNVNSASSDFGPALSPDGHNLYFHSDRPGGFGQQDIYVSHRHNKRDDFGWQFAENLGSGVNAIGNDANPAIFEDDTTGVTTLYFQSNRPGNVGGADIWASTLQSDGTFGTPAPVVDLNTAAGETHPFISRDGLEMYFTSNRAGTLGSNDLWVSTRPSTSDPWSTPVNLGPIVNSVADDSGPALSFKGTELYFTSTRLGGPDPQDLWVSRRFKLKQPD